MAWEPEFVRQLPEFLSDQKQVTDLDSLVAFEQKWFDRDAWPQLAFEQDSDDKKHGPVQLDGRWWSYTFWTYDLTPEARYHYFKYLWEVSRPLKFPGYEPAADFNAQDCPYCQISTNELGDKNQCPQCGRELVGTCHSD